MSSDAESLSKRFVQGWKGNLNWAPIERDSKLPGGNPLATRFGIAGAAAVADYLIVPALEAHRPSGTSTLESAGITFVGAFILAGISKLQGLCATDPEQKRNDALNLATGGVGAGVVGAGLLKLVPVALLAPHLALIIGASVLGAGGVGVAGAQLKNHFAKKKYCPHCRERGRCSQSVCRSCYRLFYPSLEKVDCGQKVALSWEQVASVLDGVELTYLDAMEFVGDKIGEWKLYTDSDENLYVDCDDFMSWIKANKSVVVSYRNSGKKKFSGPRDIARYLDEKML